MGSLVKLSCDVDGPLRGLGKLREEGLPFTIARALTMTAQDAQAVVRQVERGVFNTRNDWTVRNTKITPATKETLMAEVYTDTGNRTTGAPDYLEKQQDGGERVPVSGHRYLAVPTRYLWKYTSQNKPIPDNLRPRAILPADAQFGVQYGGSFAGGRAKGEKRAIAKATLKKLGQSEFVGFVQKTKGGTLCIFVRHGGLGFHGAADAEPWYVLTPSAHIPAIFPMADVVEQVVLMNFELNMTRAAAEVAVNDELRGSGLQVKF